LRRHYNVVFLFCYVNDMIEGLIRMMNNNHGLVGPINIGNPNEFTMLELAQQVISLTGSKSRLTSHPLPSDDPRQRQPDIALAREKLDWLPNIPLQVGLARTIDYFRGLLATDWKPRPV
jgi:UDP-glucuronate decarboxylase